ncbi:hypothetical protein C5Y97_01000 [Blastopirellula marina]|uniref:Uncharacterized protein n=1 Tax=Blastopirellula marina TaxID=124 RepID=A0A2S8GE74_9BACT|nr:hypothetical protein C5Y98_01000 [Blastopirellula marina]PTL46528.1 hypothetical protein C5Y97_01000 [Blastopirellula marina]
MVAGEPDLVGTNNYRATFPRHSQGAVGCQSFNITVWEMKPAAAYPSAATSGDLLPIIDIFE